MKCRDPKSMHSTAEFEPALKSAKKLPIVPGAEGCAPNAEDVGKDADPFDEYKSSKTTQKTNVTIQPYELGETSHFLKNGLRYVREYPFTFSVGAKQRWIGKNIVEMFVTEFRNHSIAYYLESICSGQIQINNRMVGFDYVIKEHDLIMHRVHRHEPPVSDQEIKIIHQDEKLVVIDKPSSIPVHPSGRYRHNSVTFILAHEHGLMNLYTTYRLDRLTSGLLIFTKSSKDANDISSQIRSYDVEKEYLARVVGEFPEGKITVDQPIFVVSDIHRKECNHISPNGKRCITQFERIFYRDNESLVRCIPKTGRTHQIRIHLKWLGYPIVNDPLYNEEYAKYLGPVLKFNPPDTKEIEDIKAASKQLNQYNSLSKIIQEKIEMNPKFQSYRPGGSKANINSIDPSMMCRDCEKVYRTPHIHELFICLHAVSYKTKSFLYKTSLPAWAEEGYAPPDWNSLVHQQSTVTESV